VDTGRACGPGSSVSIATDYGLDGLGLNLERKKYSGQIPPLFSSITVTLDYLCKMYEI